MPILFLSACKVDESKNIRRVLAGDQPLCIHKDYFDWGGDPNSGSVFIIAMRPDMRPETRKERKTLDKNTYYLKVTNILLGPEWLGITERGLKRRIDKYKQTNRKAYNDLIVTKKSADWHSGEIFLEPKQQIDNPNSPYIICLGEGANNPQCSHYFSNKKIGYKVSYSKRNLDNWAKIKQQVIEFVESKKCK